jgi:hypothetical protein
MVRDDSTVEIDAAHSFVIHNRGTEHNKPLHHQSQCSQTDQSHTRRSLSCGHLCEGCPEIDIGISAHSMYLQTCKYPRARPHIYSSFPFFTVTTKVPD